MKSTEKRFERIEKKIEESKLVHERLEARQQTSPNDAKLPKIPSNLFKTSNEFISSELNEIYNNRDYELTVNDPKNVILKNAAQSEIWFEAIEEVISVYRFTISQSQKNPDLIDISYQSNQIECKFSLSMEEVKSQKEVDSFLQNIIPKTKRTLLNSPCSFALNIEMNLNNKSRKLNITFSIPIKNIRQNIQHFQEIPEEI